MAYKKPKPVLIDSRLNNIKNALAKAMFIDVHRNCLNCANWNEEQDLCTRFKAKPPTAIIVYSCEQWEESKDWDIPF